MMKPALRRISGAILAAALVMTACTSDGIAIEDLPPLAPPAPTSTVRPVATRPPTAVPTEVPATPTVEPTATATVEPTPTSAPNHEVPDLIVEGDFTWPPGAGALTAEQQDAVNVGVSFNNLLNLVVGRGPTAAASQYESLRPHLGQSTEAFLADLRDSSDAVPVDVTAGLEDANRIVSMALREHGDGGYRVVFCFNFATTNSTRGAVEATTLFTYDTSLSEGTQTLLNLDYQSKDVILRECSQTEMQL